jgi:hypothetical protein
MKYLSWCYINIELKRASKKPISLLDLNLKDTHVTLTIEIAQTKGLQT